MVCVVKILPQEYRKQTVWYKVNFGFQEYRKQSVCYMDFLLLLFYFCRWLLFLRGKKHESLWNKTNKLCVRLLQWTPNHPYHVVGSLLDRRRNSVPYKSSQQQIGIKHVPFSSLSDEIFLTVANIYKLFINPSLHPQVNTFNELHLWVD